MPGQVLQAERFSHRTFWAWLRCSSLGPKKGPGWSQLASPGVVQTLLQPHPDLALVGDLNLPIPKLWAGTVLASMLEPRRRLDQPLHAAILVGALGCPSGVSKS